MPTRNARRQRTNLLFLGMSRVCICSASLLLIRSSYRNPKATDSKPGINKRLNFVVLAHGFNRRAKLEKGYCKADVVHFKIVQ